MDTKARFLSKVRVMGNGCHEWQSTLHRDGYGKFWHRGKQEKAHRMAYMLHVGDIPAGLHVLHTCDNRKCVNPEHLYAGTHQQNVRDKIERCAWWGRMTVPFETVQRIRSLYADGGISQQALADRYGIHQTQVSRYVREAQRLSK